MANKLRCSVFRPVSKTRGSRRRWMMTRHRFPGGYEGRVFSPKHTALGFCDIALVLLPLVVCRCPLWGRPEPNGHRESMRPMTCMHHVELQRLRWFWSAEYDACSRGAARMANKGAAELGPCVECHCLRPTCVRDSSSEHRLESQCLLAALTLATIRCRYRRTDNFDSYLSISSLKRKTKDNSAEEKVLKHFPLSSDQF